MTARKVNWLLRSNTLANVALRPPLSPAAYVQSRHAAIRQLINHRDPRCNPGSNVPARPPRQCSSLCTIASHATIPQPMDHRATRYSPEAYLPSRHTEQSRTQCTIASYHAISQPMCHRVAGFSPAANVA